MGGFFQDRVWGIFDNAAGNIIVILLAALGSIALGFILKWDAQTRLLVLLFIGQVVIIGLVTSLWRRSTSKPKQSELLVRSPETNIVYLRDRNGLHHPIEDTKTALYLMESLGYQSYELTVVPIELLKPMGSKIEPIGDWRPPKTEEDEIKYEIRSSLLLQGKHIRSTNGASVISFAFVNTNSESVKINSATLTLNSDALLTLDDISTQNRPAWKGYTSCRLLFDNEVESKWISTLEEFTLNLILRRQLSKADAGVITHRSPNLGYIVIDLGFRGKSVSIHQSV